MTRCEVLLRRLSALLSACLLAAGAADAAPVINEIHYNSPGSPDVEFIEIHNPDAAAVVLDGWYLIDDDPIHPVCQLQATLASGEFLVVAADSLLFAFYYPDVENLNPFYFNPAGTGFGLANSGDTINLHDDLDALVDVVSFLDSGDWPSSPDGGGPTLELIHPALDNNSPFSWDPSLMNWGTPGEQNSVYQVDQTPTCRAGRRDIDLPTGSDTVTIGVDAFDSENLLGVELFVDAGGGFQSQPMFDDGLHGDGAAGDSVFGAQIPPHASGTVVRYYAKATDDIGQTDTWPGSAPAEYRAYTVDHTLPDLRINEILALNQTGITDEYGQREDWIEIHNRGNQPVPIGGMYLTDDPDRTHLWALPEFALGAGEYLIVWTDDDQAQGAFHAGFKLASAGEYVGLYDSEDGGNVLISGTQFGPVGPDTPFGLPHQDAGMYEYLDLATPGAGNGAAGRLSPICINEFASTSQGGGVDDWVEVFNRGGASVDISGWHLSDDRFLSGKWAFPEGTVLDPGEFMFVDEVTLGFGFSSTGNEEIVLTERDSTVGMDFYDNGPQTPDVTEGRYPDGASFWYTLASESPGAANALPVGIADGQLPAEPLRLRGSHPNPFNPTTRIVFSLGREGNVVADIHSADGRRVRQLYRGGLQAGEHEIVWDGRGDTGEVLPSGVYLLNLRSGSYTDRGKLLLLK